MGRGHRLGLIALAVIVGFVLAMTAVYALPREPIRRHVEQSAAILEREGAGYEPFYGIDQSRLDNFSDAVMLNAAVGSEGQSPLARAMDVRVATVTGRMVFQSNVIDSMKLAATPTDKLQEPQPDLESNPITTTTSFSYARYWHGYQVVLRPALTLFTYPALRYINSILWLASTLGLAALIARKLSKRYAVTFLVTLAMFSPLTIPASLSYAGDFYLAYALSAVVLLRGSRPGWHRIDLEAFLIVGMLTNFVDLLIVPLLTLTVPLALLMILQARNHREFDWRSGLEQVSRASLAWGFGYGAAWVAKWAIGTVLLGRNLFLDAAWSAVHRVGGEVLGSGFHGFGPVGSNLALLVPGFGIESVLPGPQAEVIAAFVLLTAVVLALAFAVLWRFHHRPRRWSSLIPLWVVAAMPYAWYLMMAAHSERHYWFTYRIQLVTVFALVATYVSLLDWEAVRGAARFVRWRITRSR